MIGQKNGEAYRYGDGFMDFMGPLNENVLRMSIFASSGLKIYLCEN